MKNNYKYAHACFLSQQAGEKSLKALHYLLDSDPWGHSMVKLLEDLKAVDMKVYEIISELLEDARLLDKLFIPTQYPNGLPDINPRYGIYTESDAQNALMATGRILKMVKEIIG